jgi:hypothetical protein
MRIRFSEYGVYPAAKPAGTTLTQPGHPPPLNIVDRDQLESILPAVKGRPCLERDNPRTDLNPQCQCSHARLGRSYSGPRLNVARNMNLIDQFQSILSSGVAPGRLHEIVMINFSPFLAVRVALKITLLENSSFTNALALNSSINDN